MTVRSDQRKIIYQGNGTTTQFAVPFYFINNTDIQASVNDGTTTTDLVLGTDYTLTGAGVETGGTLTTSVPVAQGSEIAILRTVAYKQEMDIPENDIFPSQNMERALDRLTMQTQQLNEQMGRAVTVDVFSDITPDELVSEVEDLWNIKDDIMTVAGISSEVSDVSANKSNINTAVSNMAAIIDAPNQASAAAASATLAQDWATKMEGKVASTDYSSKYYASQSALSAQQAAISAAGTHFKLFQHQWFDYQPDDLAWLRADTFSWQDGTVYSNAYDHLVDDIDGVTASTETVGGYTVTFYRATDGHKIVLADQETTVSNIYTATGVAWYYVLDTVNNRFKLPRTKYGFDGLRGNVGDYISESLPNITGSLGTSASIGGFYTPDPALLGSFYLQNTTRPYGVSYTADSYNNWANVDFDASLSSSTYQDNAPVQQRGTQMYLYFYVGQYTQSATEQTAGLNAELFNNKADINAANFSSEGKLYLTSLPSPDVSNAVTYTTGASGATYTATDTGWVVVSGYYSSNMASTPQWITIQLENGPRFCIPSANGINGVGPCCYVEKGQSFAVEWENINTSYPITIKLYKAKGAV